MLQMVQMVQIVRRKWRADFFPRWVMERCVRIPSRDLGKTFPEMRKPKSPVAIARAIANDEQPAALVRQEDRPGIEQTVGMVDLNRLAPMIAVEPVRPSLWIASSIRCSWLLT